MENAVSLKKLKAEFVFCQTIQHSWEDRTGSLATHGRVTYLHGIRKLFKCAVCGTEREEIWSRVTGDMLDRQYRYPEGYSISKDEIPEDMTRKQAMRIEMLRREKLESRKKKRNG